ncbi:HTH domain-containing protein [Haloterrigena turkmenica]|uniref:HTH domain-containing protein n=1 Tax=Haloterrigena turkmenica TaxID=62320 RepID=UPI000677616B|nr:HTH domain-containing protein [Haloterrigena turkmenica]
MNFSFQLRRRSLPIDGEPVRSELVVEFERWVGRRGHSLESAFHRREVRLPSFGDETSGNRTSAVPLVELAMTRHIAI